MDHALRCQGLARSKPALFNDDHVVSGTMQRIGHPEAGNPATKDNDVIIVGHAFERPQQEMGQTQLRQLLLCPRVVVVNYCVGCVTNEFPVGI